MHSDNFNSLNQLKAAGFNKLKNVPKTEDLFTDMET